MTRRSNQDTLIGGVNGGGPVKIVTVLDAAQILGTAGVRKKIVLPREKAQGWGMPDLKVDDIVMSSIVGMRLVLLDRAQPKSGAIGGVERYDWEVVVTPLTSEVLQRWFATPKHLSITDAEMGKSRPEQGASFHMGREVRRIAHRLSKLRPPAGSIFEVFFAIGKDGVVRVTGVASSLLLRSRQRGLLKQENQNSMERWKASFFGTILSAIWSDEKILGSSRGPEQKVLPELGHDPWQPGGCDHEMVMEIVQDATQALDALWRAVYIENDARRQQLHELGWQTNGMPRTILGKNDVVVGMFLKESGGNRSTMTDGDIQRIFSRSLAA
jgi:hypothetical protein